MYALATRMHSSCPSPALAPCGMGCTRWGRPLVSQEENVLQSTARLAVTFSKIWCQVTSFSIGTVVLGFWLCEIGVLSILSFAMVCIGVTLVCCLVIYYRTSRAINRVIPADIPA